VTSQRRETSLSARAFAWQTRAVTTSHWGTKPRASIAAECDRRGRHEVVIGCEQLVRGEQVDADLLRALAGPGAPRFLAEDRDDDYWPRVWGVRGLMWAWDGTSVDTIRVALRDDHWRVREMALKVTARHTLDELLHDVLPLRYDGTARVRAAAERAVVALTAQASE
jgi:hypothetical protein